MSVVVKRYHYATVIHGVDLAFEDGEFIVFVGPSGCGKSTLLRMICGLETASEGDILIDGTRINEVPAAQRGLAMVFQSYALYPHMTVYQNVAFGLENIGTPKAEIAAQGQRSGTHAAARALSAAAAGGALGRPAPARRDWPRYCPRAAYLLFDEPLSKLDAEVRVQGRAEIAQLHDCLGTSMVYVTHDQVEAMTMADRIVVFRAERVEQVGTPLDLYNNPANAFVAGFIGTLRMNFLKGRIAATDGGLAVTLDGTDGIIRTEAALRELAVGAPVTIGIRPEHVALGHKGLNDVSFTVGHSEQLGGATTLFFPEPGFAVQLPGQVPARRGEGMALNLPPERVHVFDADDKARPAAFAITQPAA